MTLPVPTDVSLEIRWTTLQSKIGAVCHLLRSQGSITFKRVGERRVWRLRFFETHPSGRRVQRSIHIGTDAELVRRVRFLLGLYRGEFAREAAALASLAGAFGRLVPAAGSHKMGQGYGPRRTFA